jgi:hypothetical protein
MAGTHLYYATLSLVIALEVSNEALGRMLQDGSSFHKVVY